MVKKVLLVVLALIISIGMMGVAAFAEGTEKPYAETTKGSAVIDGKDTDSEWADVPVNNIDRFKFGTGIEGDSKGTFKAKWDGSNLYVLVEIQDSSVSNNGDLEKQDRIQTYIDYSNAGTGNYNDPALKQYQFAINRSGTSGQYDSIEFDLNNNLEYKVIDSADGYTIEYKLGLAAIAGEDVADVHKQIGFDIQISDNETGTDTRSAAYGWSDNVDQAWRDASYLGKLMLVSPTNTETPEPEPEETEDNNVDATSTATTGDEDPDDKVNMLLIIGIGAGVIIAVALVLAYVSNKKKK